MGKCLPAANPWLDHLILIGGRGERIEAPREVKGRGLAEPKLIQPPIKYTSCSAQPELEACKRLWGGHGPDWSKEKIHL